MDNRNGQVLVRMRDHWKFVAICIWVSLVSFNLGIDISTVASMRVMPGFLQVREMPMDHNIQARRIQILTLSGLRIRGFSATYRLRHCQIKAATARGTGAFGKYCVRRDCGLLSKIMGRRLSLAVGCVIFITATVILMVAVSTDVLFLGRFLLGVGIGDFYVFVQLYVQVW